MISQESIERVKAEASIVEVVSETVKLRRSGMYYSGLCPFHSERSPSFFVRESSNSYHCYGCSASGNVISFVMASRAMTFPDAVEFLAGRYGIELKRERWTDYTAKLRALHTREAVMKQHGAQLPAAADLAPEVPASAASGAMRGVAAKDREVFGDKLPPKTVLLTFDDGPHPRYTDEILDILKRYQAPAVFFQLGQNLGGGFGPLVRINRMQAVDQMDEIARKVDEDAARPFT